MSELQAHVQGRFTFNGRDVGPGDVIVASELSCASQTAIDALVGQKLVVLKPVGDDGVETADDRIPALRASVDRLSGELAALKTALPAAVKAAVAEAMRSVNQRQRHTSKGL